MLHVSEKRYDLTHLDSTQYNSRASFIDFYAFKVKITSGEKKVDKKYIHLSIYTQQWIGIDFHFVATMFVTQEICIHKNLYKHISTRSHLYIPEIISSAGELNGKLFQTILALCNSWQRESTSKIIFPEFWNGFRFYLFLSFSFRLLRFL